MEDWIKNFRKYGLENYDAINYAAWGLPYTKADFPNRCMVLLENAFDTDIHPSFAEQLGIQITREIERITGINKVHKYDIHIQLFYDENNHFVINKNGFSYLDSTLAVLSLNSIVSIYFKYKSLATDKPYINFSDEVNEDMIKFSIVLDEDELPPEYKYGNYDFWIEEVKKAHYLCAPKLVLAGKSGYSFAVETRFPMFPDVNYEIYFKGKVDKKRIEALSRAVSDYIENYNAESEKKKKERFIHYCDIPEESITERTIELYVDFGSASTRALKELLAALDQAGLDIDMVSID